MQDFYVYLHRRKSDGLVFYVGKGFNKRATHVHGRNEHWNRVALKHGVIAEIVFDNLTEEEAFQAEIDVIKEFKYYGHPLCNKTNGGEGVTGNVMSQEARNKISVVHKGRVKSEQECLNISAGRKGCTFTLEARENMRLCQLGKKQSEETKQKRKDTFKDREICKDKNIYTFQNCKTNEIFVGTRKQLALKTGIPTKKFRTLFQTLAQKTCHNWRLIVKINKEGY